MKIKKVKLSFLICAGLIILSYGFLSYAEEKSSTANNIFLDSDQDGLSDEEEKAYGTDPQKPDTDGDGYSDGAEVKSGYDPKKPAPGDKIAQPNAEITTSASQTTEEKNLTESASQKISALMKNTNEDNPAITQEQISEVIEQSLSEDFTETELPEISIDDIKIKKQNYSKLSSTEAAARKKEDFSKYLAAIYYIFSSNSPKPITTNSDLSSITKIYSQNIITAISSGNPSAANDLVASAQKSLEQMQALEVPEDAVNIHIKGLQFIQYATTMKDSISTKESDPLAYLASLVKIQAFMGALQNFSDETKAKLNEYGFENDDILNSSIKNLGLPTLNEAAPQADLDNSNTSAENDSN